MTIGISVDRPVQCHTQAQLHRLNAFHTPLEKIPQQIPKRNQPCIRQHQQMP